MKARTLGEVARFFGVAEQTVKQWRSGPDPMPGKPGSYDLGEIAQWRQRRTDARRPEASAKKQDIDTARAAVRLQMEKHKLDVQEENLLPRRIWELFAATLLTRLGDLADQLPDLIAGEVPSKYRKRIRDRLKMELDQWRTDVAEELKHGPAPNAAE